LILNSISELSTAAADRYRLFTDGLRGIYARAVSNPDFGRVSHREKVLEEARIASQVFVNSEVDHLQDAVNDIFRAGHQTTLDEIASVDSENVSELALEQLTATLSYLYDEVRAQVTRDVAQLKTKLRMAVLEISVASKVKGVSMRSAQIEYRIANSGDIQFVFRDRASRNWASDKYVRTLWRHTLLSVYNEAVITALADHGVASAVVTHQDEKADVHGMRISLSPGSELPLYSEVRDVVFHPNANAYLTTEFAHVSA
jgi:hypothetical protein